MDHLRDANFTNNNLQSQPTNITQVEHTKMDHILSYNNNLNTSPDFSDTTCTTSTSSSNAPQYDAPLFPSDIQNFTNAPQYTAPINNEFPSDIQNIFPSLNDVNSSQT